MIFTIHKGSHKSKPKRIGFFFGRHTFRWKVLFTESCKYDLVDNDQLDTNKLVGIGYLPGHHKHSARFGWRYAEDHGKVELLAYCYIKGVRVIKSISSCDIGKEYRIQLQITNWSYLFECNGDEVKIDHNHKKKFQYRLGIYFGGNEPAPHEIKIELI